MLFPIGIVIVFASVIMGYTIHGGNLKVLYQPTEFLIIGGAAVGSFLVSNPMTVVKDVVKSMKTLFKGKPFNKEDYLELVAFLFDMFKIMKTKGMLEIEQDIDDPKSSELFRRYPKVLAYHHGVEFICDTMRVISMGVDDHFQMDELMEKELEIHHMESEQKSSAVSTMADGLPALGIVAAVLGVINTMGSITEPPEVLGQLIGAALVGTFLGVLLAYGMVGPIGAFLAKYGLAEVKYYECIKAAVLAHIQGNAPTISIEFARKSIPSHFRPTFEEVEARINGGSK